jgi:hypothetical protein
MPTRSWTRALACIIAVTAFATACPPGPNGGSTTTTAVSTPRPTPPSPSMSFTSQRCASVRAAATTNPGRYSAGSPFRVPAACAGLASDSGLWASRWFEATAAPSATPSSRGRVATNFFDFSTPTYEVSVHEPIQWVRVFAWDGTSSVPNGTLFPYSPEFLPSGSWVNGLYFFDSDAIYVVYDRRTGQEWRVWNAPYDGIDLRYPNARCLTDASGRPTGFVIGRDLCVGGAYYAVDPDGSDPDASSTGIGGAVNQAIGKVFPLAGIATADELIAGDVHHPLMMSMYKTMFGAPVCPSGSTDISGSGCGTFLFPASRVEHASGPASCGVTMNIGDRATTLPQGMWFALNLSDAEVEWWLDSRGYSGTKRATVTKLVRALREYGFMVGPTSCGGAGLALDGAINPGTAFKWKNELGIDPAAPSAKGLLDGLIASPDNVVRLNPPAAS